MTTPETIGYTLLIFGQDHATAEDTLSALKALGVQETDARELMGIAKGTVDDVEVSESKDRPASPL